MSGHKDQRSEGETVNALWSFGATAKIFRDRGVRFACESTKLEPLRILYFNIFDRGGNLFKLASDLYCSEDKTAIRFGGWISAYTPTPP